MVSTAAPKCFQYNEKVPIKCRNYTVYWNLDEIWKYLLLTMLSCPPNTLPQNFVVYLKGQNLFQKCSFFVESKVTITLKQGLND